MRQVKLRFPHYWIEFPASTRLVDLAQVLAHTRLRLRWNVQQRRLEVSRPGGTHVH